MIMTNVTKLGDEPMDTITPWHILNLIAVIGVAIMAFLQKLRSDDLSNLREDIKEVREDIRCMSERIDRIYEKMFHRSKDEG